MTGYQRDATALAQAIRTGETSAAGVMEASIAAAEGRTDLGAVDLLDAAVGRRQAELADLMRQREPQAFARQPFAGVPFLVKDLGSPFAGFPVHAGSAALARRVTTSTGDSDLAARFRAAGLLPFGRTTVPEFGLSLASEPAKGRPVRNPLDPSRTAGGSSGGAASAVAGGIVAIAHATDAGGSIRVPAACCGLIGLKPSRGAVPGGPGFGNHLGGLASELVISRSVRDTAAALRAVSGRAEGPMPDPDLHFSTDAPSIASLRIAVVEDFGDAYPLDPTRRDGVREAGKALVALGHRLTPLPFARLAPLVEASERAFDRIVCVNLALLLETLAIAPDEVEPLSAAVADRGRRATATDLFSAEQEMVLVAHAVWSPFREHDAILTPMLATAPPPLGSFPTDGDDVPLHWRRMTAFAPLATLANAAGIPAITLPFGTDADGMPLPVQILAPIAGDARLLALASQLEAIRPFPHHFPIAGVPA